MKRVLYILGICGLCHLSANAQYFLKGEVRDETKHSVPSATLRLLDKDSAFVVGCVSDENGLFSFTDIKQGSYILAISYIGYSPQTISFDMPQANHSLPVITLRNDNVMLDAVTITGSSFIQKKDHLLIVPEKKQVKHAFSGYDLLYNLMIPGLTVDRKNKTVTGITGEATLYINGVKADMREVQYMQPKDIERIEYYTLPTTGPFTGDAASINYITKTYKSGGYITVDGEQTIGYQKGDYNLGAKLSHKNTTYTLFGGYNLRSYDGVKNENTEELFLEDYTIRRVTANDGAAFKGNQQYTQFKVSNDTDKRNLSAMASFVRDAKPYDDQNGLLHYTGQEEQIIRSFDQNNSESLRGSINLKGTFIINEHKQWKTRLNGSFTKNRYDRIYMEGKQNAVTNANEDLYSFDAQVAYLYQPNKSNSLYSRLTHFHNVSSSLYGGDYDSWQHLWTGETLLQVDYTHMFGQNVTLMVSPGATCMNYKLHGDGLRKFLYFRTNAWVRYVINPKQWAGIGFSLGNDQPNISYMNTANTAIDLYQIKRGNPDLDNTRLFTAFALYEATLHKLFNFQCRLWYTQNDHNIYTNYYLEKNKLISSYASDDSYNTANAEASISSRISDNLRMNLRFTYGYMYVPGKSNLSQKNFTTSFDVNYLIKAFAINAYVRTPEKILDAERLAFRKTPVSYGMSLRYSGKKWMAEVGTENPFSKHLHYREWANYGVYTYNRMQTSRIYQQTAYIKLAYTFDFGKKTAKESNDVDKSINSAILKAK